MKNMGIREKIRLGFLALGLLLFFSGLISFFELSKLSRSTQSMLGASLKNMELSKTMLDAVQDQNTALLQIIVSGRSDRESDSLLHAGREKFEAAISDAKISIRDLQGFDSVYAANISYNETVGAYLRDSLRKENVDWFVDIYKTSYSDLTSSIKNFMVSSQNMMDAKARRLEDNAYRATMPGFIALVIAIVIVLIFYYFVNLYYAENRQRSESLSRFEDAFQGDYRGKRRGIQTEGADRVADRSEQIKTVAPCG